MLRVNFVKQERKVKSKSKKKKKSVKKERNKTGRLVRPSKINRLSNRISDMSNFSKEWVITALQ